MATTTVKLTTVGNSVGIILPKELLAKLRVDKGDALFLTDTPSGFQASVYEEKIAQQMSAVREVMRENREALRELAK
ncbi:MAG: AbrB/MazE/SpoVT family DNA-binding domain-containing protein [Acidobacteria bacterium]|nr:AbrB/MazE/SpoVT family DNA-binding domain-containing protein [Acidobacteriota bacterium]